MKLGKKIMSKKIYYRVSNTSKNAGMDMQPYGMEGSVWNMLF